MVNVAYFETSEISLVDCMELFFSEKESKSNDTAKTYFYGINNMSNEIFKKDMSRLTRQEIESLNWSVLNKYKMKLKETCTNTTINNRISAIKSLIRYLTARNAITYNIAELDLVQLLKDDSEGIERIPLDVLMDYCQYFEIYERHGGVEKKWLSLLLLETGNRVQDLLSITKNQFVKDGDDYILKSKGKNRGKGNKEYVERIGSEIYEELMKLNPESDKVFRIKYNAIIDAFNRANEHFGNTVIRYTPHSIKHLSVYLEYRFTGDILCAQEKGKHSSIETTRKYLKIENTSRIGAYSRMLSTKEDKFKNASLSELVNVISELPMDVQFLINKKLEDLSINNHDKI